MKYIIFFVIFLIGNKIFCQEPERKNNTPSVVFSGVKKWGHPTSVQFYDTISGNIIQNFNFHEKNPYNLPYKLTSVSRDTTRWEFEIERGMLVDTTRLFSSDYTICTHPDRTPKYIESSVILTDLQGDFVIIAYQMITMNQYKEGIGGMTTIYILNQKGNVLQEFKNLPHDCSSIAINSTGKHLMVCYAGPYNCSDNEYIRRGIRIFEVSTKKEIYKSNIFDENGVGQIDDGLFIIRNTIANRGERYMFFDPENRIVYRKDFAFDEQKCIKRVTKKDFIMQCNESSGEFSLTFRSFQKEKF